MTSDQSYYRPLFRLLAQIDRDIAEFYAEHGAHQVSMRFIGPLLSLGDSDAGMTVKDLARVRDVTHSAMSQTVAAMTAARLVSVGPGADGRYRVVTLTDHGRAVIPLIRAEWQATEKALREIDQEISHPLMQAVQDVIGALDRVPFPARLRAHLGEVDR